MHFSFRCTENEHKLRQERRDSMVTDSYTRIATVRRIVDGDTLDVMVDCGFRRYSIERLRLARINTPETRGEERQAGLVSKSFVEAALPIGSRIALVSTKEDAFGRWLSEVYYLDEMQVEQNLSDALLANGLAETYER